MINVVNVEERPACILFGQPVRGGQQAAWFSESEIDAARKAKNAKTLASLAPVPPELDEVVKGLARGRVEGGQVVLAKATPDAYAKLLAATAAQRRGKWGAGDRGRDCQAGRERDHRLVGGQARSRCDRCPVIGHGHG